MKSPNKTCGKQFNAVCADLEELAWGFYDTGDLNRGLEFELGVVAGHILGNLEKVYLGACGAMMIHPNTSEIEKFDRAVIYTILKHYDGLHEATLQYADRIELWVLREEALIMFNKLTQWVDTPNENAGVWHYLRGKLTGIPFNEIDFDYNRLYEKTGQ